MNVWSLSMNEDIFNTQEEEIRRLAEEIRGTREVLSDLSRTLTKIENRFQRAFPSVQLRSTHKRRERSSSIGEQPILTPEQALHFYDEMVQQAKAGNIGAIKERLTSITVADLSLLRQELGISLGKKKPSRKTLTDSILSRLNESIMLSKHVNRDQIVRPPLGSNSTEESNPDNQV